MRFEDIKAWQKAEELTLAIYATLEENRDFGFRDQIQRASISIMNNIAEGFERKSKPSFINFLNIANGSAAEVRSMIHVALRRGYISEVDYKRFHDLCIQVSSMIFGLIVAIRKEIAEANYKASK